MTNRTDEIERKIDRDVAGALVVGQHGAGTMIAPRNMSEVMEFAKLMAISGVCVRPVFRGNPGACLAIAIQAMKWGADPFAVANKAYVVKNKSGEEQIAYEAQLVHAIVNSSPVLERRLRPVFEGEGGKRRCRIVGMVKGETEPLEYESPPIERIGVKNSPLWVSDPDQQLFYYSTRAWARRHVPEVLLGIYAPEEFQGETIDLTPTPEPRREDFIDQQRKPEPEPEPQRYAVVDTDWVEHTFARLAIAVDALRAVLQEAARTGVEALDGMWESNDSLIEVLRGDADLPAQADALAEEYAQLRDRAKPKPTSTRKPRAAASAGAAADQGSPAGERLGLGVAGDAQGSAQASEAPGPSDDTSRGEPTHTAPPPATAQHTEQDRAPERSDAPGSAPASSPAAQGRDPRDDDRFPGDLPQGERMVPRNPPQTETTAPATVAPANVPTPAAVTNRPASATNGQPPATDRPSKRIATPAGGLRIWWIALMGPKVRRETDGTELAFLIGDNQHQLDACKAPGALAADELADLEKDIAQAWQRCQ